MGLLGLLGIVGLIRFMVLGPSLPGEGLVPPTVHWLGQGSEVHLRQMDPVLEVPVQSENLCCLNCQI